MISFTRSAPEWTLGARNVTCRNWLNFLLINTVTRIWALRLITRFYLRGVISRRLIYFSFIQKSLAIDFTAAPVCIFCGGLRHLQIPFKTRCFGAQSCALFN
jgi:hypothetical protein